MKRLLVLSVFLLGILTACTQGAVEPDTVTYGLNQVGDSGVEGSITFERASATETMVTVSVDGTTEDVQYVADLHMGDINADDPQIEGNPFRTLDPLVGGNSATLVNLSYADLVNRDAFASVHSGQDGPVVAAGEIGEGAVTCKITVDCP